MAFNRVSLAARPDSPMAWLCASVPLLVMLMIAVGYGVTQRLSYGQGDPLLGQMRRSDAIAFSEALCTQVAGTPAKAVNSAGYTNAGVGDADKRWNTWQVLCQAGDFQYTFRIDADHREVTSVHREEKGDPFSGTAERTVDETVLAISRRNDDRQASHSRRYLAMAGLPVPATALVRNQGGHDFTYQIADQPTEKGDPEKRTRLFRVRLDPENGSLISLLNSVSRKYVR